MLSTAALLVASIAEATTPPQTAASYAQLGKARYAIFHATKDLPNSGWFIGGEGSSHDDYFPIGRDDRVYYVSFAAGDPWSQTRCQITCWAAKGRKYEKQWQLNLVEGGAKPSYQGTLERLASEHGSSFQSFTKTPKGYVPGKVVSVYGFHFNKHGILWAKASKELAARQYLVNYTYGIHGDVSLQGFVEVLDPNLKKLSQDHIDVMGNMPVPSEEVRLISTGAFLASPPSRESRLSPTLRP